MSEPELANWRRRIERFLAAASGHEVSEEDELLFRLAAAGSRVEENHGKLLLRLWSGDRAWVRRVVGVAEESADRLALEVERFGGRPSRLVIRAPRHHATPARAEREAARRAYSRWLTRLLEREFPRARLEGLSSSGDLKRTFSAHYTRARLREGDGWWAVMAAPGAESAAAEGLLAYALVWFDWNRRHYLDRRWVGLRLFLPEGRTQATAARLACLSVRAELYATDEEAFTCRRVEPRDVGNLDTFLAPARRDEEVRSAESSAVERIRALAPGEIEEVVHAARNELSLRYRGLEFARSVSGQVTFGVNRDRRRLTPGNFRQLEKLVQTLRRERAGTGSPRHCYYRAQAERWLESLVRAAPQAIDPRLAPERLYRQVPAFSGGERGVADLLGATRDGQLVVIELKVSPDVNLPLQALDYWLRVWWHHRGGDLARFGYFPGLALKPDPPELLLVAPALQFHPTTETLVAYLAPEVRVTLVGLGEDWRRALKVISRRTSGGILRAPPPAG